MMRATSLLLCATLCACGSLGSRDVEPEGTWLERDVAAPSSSVVRETVMGAFERLHYPVGSGFDPVAQEIESSWQTHMGVFRNQGFRRQAVARYAVIEPGRYHIEVRVKRQRNESLAAPTDPSRAEWKWEDDDGLAAGILMQHVLSAFDVPLELGAGEATPGPWAPPR